MHLPSPELITVDLLMLWLMHRLSAEFKEHAILKGGMELMLLSSDRATNDLDYVFTPFSSKMEVVPLIDRILTGLPGASVEKSFHSNSGRYRIYVGPISVQLEYNVDQTVRSTAITTQLLATRVGALPQIIRVMSPEVAFSHKLAAWNERRLLRDLYDCYFWYAIAKAVPDLPTLDRRLAAVNSRLPALKKLKSMSRESFLAQFESTIDALTEADFVDQLRPLVPPAKLVGLLPVLQAQLRILVAALRLKIGTVKS